jgi:HEAT repeat protein
MNLRIPTSYRRVPSVILVLVVLLGAACSGEAPHLRQAHATFDATCQADPKHATYGLTVAVASESSFGRQLALESVASSNYGTAVEALRVLANDPSPDAQTVLQEAFDGKKAVAQKLLAAIGLARLGDAAARDWVQAQVDSGAAITAPALVLLAESDPEGVSARLQGLMKSDEPSVRNQAYSILGEMRYPWATELLLEGLSKEFGEGRLQPIVSLGRSGDPAVAAKIQPFVTFQGLVFASIEALGALGNRDVLPSLEAMIEHDQKLVRVYASAAMWRLGEEASVAEVVETLAADEEVQVRENVAVQLAAIDSARALSILSTLASDAEETVRREALRSLSARDAGVDAFVPHIEDESYQVATVALDALARLASLDVLPSLRPLLESPNPYVALSAANAIVSISEREGPAI